MAVERGQRAIEILVDLGTEVFVDDVEPSLVEFVADHAPANLLTPARTGSATCADACYNA